MSTQPSLKRLISTLHQLELTSREIADVLWLATQMESIFPGMDSREPLDHSDDPEKKASASGQTDAVSDDPFSPRQLFNDAPDRESDEDLDSDEAVEILPSQPSLDLPPHYKHIPVRDAPTLAQPLVLARSLRHLACQINVGEPTILDEAATVDFVAETGTWCPVLEAASELKFDVSLVFDASPSMAIWQRLHRDLQRLLARYGEFRDVRLSYYSGAMEGDRIP